MWEPFQNFQCWPRWDSFSQARHVQLTILTFANIILNVLCSSMPPCYHSDWCLSSIFPRMCKNTSENSSVLYGQFIFLLFESVSAYKHCFKLPLSIALLCPGRACFFKIQLRFLLWSAKHSERSRYFWLQSTHDRCRVRRHDHQNSFCSQHLLGLYALLVCTSIQSLNPLELLPVLWFWLLLFLGSPHLMQRDIWVVCGPSVVNCLPRRNCLNLVTTKTKFSAFRSMFEKFGSARVNFFDTYINVRPSCERTPSSVVTVAFFSQTLWLYIWVSTSFIL